MFQFLGCLGGSCNFFDSTASCGPVFRLLRWQFAKIESAGEMYNLYLSGNGGKIRLQDRFSRRITGSQQFRIAEFSGTSSSYGAFGEELSFSGKFFSGLNATFKDESGINVPGEYQSTTTISNTGYVFRTKVPRDIVFNNFMNLPPEAAKMLGRIGIFI